MKKALSFLLFVLLLALSVPALAESDGMRAAQELTNLWESGGYPNDVGGVFYDSISGSGKCGVLLTSLSDAREAEIRALVSEPNTVFFVKCSYSYNELLAVQKQIIQTYLHDGGIVGCGVGWTTKDNHVKGFGESGFEMRVCVDVLEADYEKYTALFSELYGEKVYVGVSPGIWINGVQVTGIPQTGSAEMLAGFAVIGLALALATVTTVKRHSRRSTDT